MIDLNPTKAEFGTGSLVGGAEVFPSATQGSIAKNTGANWYTPECLSMQWGSMALEGSFVGAGMSTKAYLREGTYQMWGAFYLEVAQGRVRGDILVDGTNLIYAGYVEESDWYYGSAEVIAENDGTYTCQFVQTLYFFGTNEGTLSDGAVFFQRL